MTGKTESTIDQGSMQRSKFKTLENSYDLAHLNKEEPPYQHLMLSNSTDRQNQIYISLFVWICGYSRPKCQWSLPSGAYSVREVFLNLDTNNVLVWSLFVLAEGWPVHCRMFSIVPGLDPVNISCTHPSNPLRPTGHDNQKYLQALSNHPWLRNTGINVLIIYL